jgi:hypothetical protein
MKKWTIGALAAATVAVLVPLAAVQVASAGVSSAKQQQKSGAITIQSWLDAAAPSENVLSSTVWDCFKITGALTDQGGGPVWSNDTEYHAPNSMTTGGIAAAAKECSDEVPAGGFILVPPPEPGQYQFAQYTSPAGLSTVYATHTIAGQRGDIFISFSGTYNMTNSAIAVKLSGGSSVEVQPLTTGPQCSWVITGGTGAYSGLQGNGTCFANAENTFPYINHTENGKIWWAR